MRFFTKYKQAFEKWFRTLIAEEVASVDASLQHEKEELRSHLVVFGAQITKFNQAVEHLAEVSYFKENTELRSTIKQLTAHSADLVDTVKRLHPTT